MKKNLLFYFIFFCLFSFLFLFLFHTPLFGGQKVLFYRGLWLLGIATFIFALLSKWVTKKWKIKCETYIAVLVLSISLNLVFFIVFPVTFDRSVTMFLLNKISLHSPTTVSNLEESLIKKYIQENKAVQRRINEQSQIGFVSRENQEIILSEKAKKFLEFAGWVKRMYGIN